MKRTPVTLRDVAREADVHPSTASRALNDHARAMVNPETVQRVLEAAKALGYRPNSLARGLKLSRTFTVGMLIPDLTNPLFPPIVRGIENALMDAGYTLVLANTDNSLEKERSVLESMQLRRVDGLIIATAQRDDPVIEELLAAEVPVVLINRVSDTPGISAVTGDDYAGVGLAVRHLIALGHRRIAHVAGPQTLSTGLVRYEGFQAWIRREGLEYDDALVAFAGGFQEEPGARAFSELLDRGQPFTAVVAATDLIALGCYDVLRDRRMVVPADMSVVGYNDIPFCDKFSPPLTTVRIPHYEVGVKAAELMLKTVQDPTTTPVSLRLPPALVTRESTGPPPG
jgi:LacI family transcriptional regulator